MLERIAAVVDNENVSLFGRGEIPTKDVSSRAGTSRLTSTRSHVSEIDCTE